MKIQTFGLPIQKSENKKSIDLNKSYEAERNRVDDKHKYIPDQMKEVAKGMEQQFAEHLINELDKSKGEMGGSSASKFYKGLMTSEQAKKLVDQNLGLQDVILDQVYPKKFRNERSYNFFKAQQEQNNNRNQSASITKHDTSLGDKL